MIIKSAKVVHGYVVRLYLDDGTHVDRDFAFVRGPVFDRCWRNPRLFARVKVIDGSLTWPGEVDFCSDSLLWGGKMRGRPPGEAIVGPMGTLISSARINAIQAG